MMAKWWRVWERRNWSSLIRLEGSSEGPEPLLVSRLRGAWSWDSVRDLIWSMIRLNSVQAWAWFCSNFVSRVRVS